MTETKPSARYAVATKKPTRRIDHADTFAALWALLAPNGTPEPEREYQFAPPRRFAFDFAWPRYHVAVEVDGGQWTRFGGRHATDGDREKLNLATELGWRILRYSPRQLDYDGAQCVEQVLRCFTCSARTDRP